MNSTSKYRYSRLAVSIISATSLLSLQILPLTQAIAAEPIAAATSRAITAPAMTRADYEACQARDEAGFRAAVETITRRALHQGLKTIDYDGAVGDAWRRKNMQQIINAEVDRVVKNVSEETDWLQLIKSLASQDKAKELATTVATRVYRSDKVKKAIEALAIDVGTSVSKRIELATVDAAEPARKCMQAFLGSRFGTTIARVVSTDAGNRLELDSGNAGAEVSSGSILLRSSGGIAGVMVLIVRRQLAKIAARVGQRVLGAVLSRLVSVVAGGVGIVLIAKDIWDMRNGVLPIISDEMKSPVTARKVRQELSKEIKQQINLNIDDLAARSAGQVVKIWRDYRQAHSKVLDLAERNTAFRTFLNSVPAGKLAQLDDVVALTLASENEAGLLQRLADGTLDEAVKNLPPAAITIARDTRSIKSAFQWRALAGEQLDEIVRLDIHRQTTPEQLTKQGLQRILSLKDDLAISRLIALPRDARATLFQLAQKDMASLARSLQPKQLNVLSGYLTGLNREAGQRLLFAVAANPAKMYSLARPGVQNALLGSADQLAAVNMMVRSNNTFDVTTFFEDLSLLRELKITPWLLWQRYPASLSVLAGVSLLILLMLWRLIFGRRPKVIVQMPPGHQPRSDGEANA